MMNNNLLIIAHSCHKILIDQDLIGGVQALHDILRLIFIKLYKPELLNNAITWTTLESACNKIIFNSDDNWKCSPNSLELIRVKIMNYNNQTKINHDIIGYIYEDFINKYSSSAKLFGQFFTTRNYIQLIFDQTPNGLTATEPFTMFDPCMGTGGFIMEAYKYFNISASNLSGCELEPETYKYALMNIMTTTRDKYNTDNFINGNALIMSDPRIKYNLIPTNPPYGTKMNYKNLESLYNIRWATELNDITFPKWADIFPIKTNNGVALFLQFIAYKLKPGGIAIPIIPNGEIIYGRNFGKLRKYLSGYVTIDKIMHVTAGAFKHADVKTSVLWMQKKTTADCLQNKAITILHADKHLIEPSIIGTICVSPDKNWSWEIDEYKIHKTPEWMGCKWMRLGDICVTISVKNRLANYGKPVGLYPYYTSSPIIKSYVDEPDFTTESLIMGAGGHPNINYDVKFSAADHCRIYQTREDITDINLKYVYYYISNNMHVLSDLFRGMAILHITKRDAEGILIPIPDIDTQNKIIEEVDAGKKIKLDYETAARIDYENKLTEIDRRCKAIWPTIKPKVFY